MENVFPDAAEARRGARDNTVIYGEIRNIETAVLAAIDSGLLSVTVSNTTMTSSNPTGQSYCLVWIGDPSTYPTDWRSKYEQMQIIIQYFSDMGYTIRRKLNVTVNPGSVVSATSQNGDASSAEIQTIVVGTVVPKATYSLVVGTLTLKTNELTASPSATELLLALQATAGYATAPFILSLDPSGDLILTWKTIGDVTDVAALSYTTTTDNMNWELLW